MSEDAPEESGLEAFLTSPLVPELRRLALAGAILNHLRPHAVACVR